MFLDKFLRRNELEIYRQYRYYGDYHESNKVKKSSIKKIYNILTKGGDGVDKGVFINSRFNGLYYPFFDLDDTQKLNLFEKINKDIPYVIFQSSPGHYWGILDTPTKRIEDIIELDPSWKICNDEKYVKLVKEHKVLFIRSTYYNHDRKPKIYYINGELSQNLELFIDEVKKFLNGIGLEVSVLIHKSDDLLEELMIRKRKDKILNIRNKVKVLV